MYTVDDKKVDEYEEESQVNNYWDKNKSLVFKIIIIILCIIVLIWLFKALNVKRNTVDGSIYVANVQKVRLASEDYFFIKNNKYQNGDQLVTLSELQSEGLVDTIIDANNKVCNANSSTVALNHEIDGYKMTVNLDCSTNDKEKNFYYHNNSLACLNCHGDTKMTGIKKEVVEEAISYVVPSNPVTYSNYSCINWSDWTKKRDTSSNLLERSKTLVYGVKYQDIYKVIYGPWSSYTKVEIVANENLEVETKNSNGKLLYRSRSISKVLEKTVPIYTNDKYEINSLPKGYVKVSGSEETYYSYKYSNCEK